MSDDRLRAAERRYRETQSLEDEAALLTLRLRSGALPLEVLELAGYADHPAACAVLAQEAPYPRATALNRDLIALADGRPSDLESQLAGWSSRLMIGFGLCALHQAWGWLTEAGAELDRVQERWDWLWVGACGGEVPSKSAQPFEGDPMTYELTDRTVAVTRALWHEDESRLAQRCAHVVGLAVRYGGTVGIRQAVLAWARTLLVDPTDPRRPDRL